MFLRQFHTIEDRSRKGLIVRGHSFKLYKNKYQENFHIFKFLIISHSSIKFLKTSSLPEIPEYTYSPTLRKILLKKEKKIDLKIFNKPIITLFKLFSNPIV